MKVSRNSQKARTWRLVLIQRPWWSAAGCLAHHGLFSMMSYSTLDHQPRDGAILIVFINHQSRKYFTVLSIGLPDGGSLSVEFVSFLMTLILGQIDIEPASRAVDTEILFIFFLLLNDKHVC